MYIYIDMIFMQGYPDRDADFYLKESPDGTVSFESVTCPGVFVNIPSGKNSPCVTNFTVDLVVGLATDCIHRLNALY